MASKKNIKVSNPQVKKSFVVFECVGLTKHGQMPILPLPLKKVSLPRFFFESFKFKFVLIAPEITPELSATPSDYFQDSYYKHVIAFENKRGTQMELCVGNVVLNANTAEYANTRGVTVCRFPLIVLSKFQESEDFVQFPPAAY